ncbi:MAG: transposase [Acidobacteria bacterium]|nr:transposase [Acidobacteriota bacterium]
MAKLPGEATRFRAASFIDQVVGLASLRKHAKLRLSAQARLHPDYAVLAKLPGFGSVRIAQLIAAIGTPHRFRTKR